MPVFVAEVPADGAIATEAWGAAAECTGREGRAHPTVEIVRGAIHGDYLGVARHDERGIWRIELEPDDERIAEVIVHEVAHAWVTAGPPALAEGVAELLADCVVTRRPGLAAMQWDDGRALPNLPDLRGWTNTDDHGPAVLADQRTDAYLGAARLVRTAALLVDDGALWPEGGLDWTAFAALLSASADGRALLAVVEGGADAQRDALADADLDGLPAIAERFLGTDPARWDSDGDGWWDGSALGVPARSVAPPLDGTPVCLGLRGGPAGGTAGLLSGGNLRGSDLPDARLRAGGAAPGDRVAVGPREPVLVELAVDGAPFTGGAWGRVRGVGLEADPWCVTTPTVSIWAADPALGPAVAELLPRIEASATRSAARWGPAPIAAVSLGGTRTVWEGGVLYLAADEIARARRRGRLDELAALAITVPRTWRAGVYDWPAAEALARALWADGS